MRGSNMAYQKNTRFDYQTNVRMNKNKKELAQRKGYKLQEILDIALDVLLDADDLESQEIMQEINELESEIQKLKLRQDMLRDRLDQNREAKRDKIKNKGYEELKTIYKNKWDFDEEDLPLIDEVALTLNISRIEVQNRIIDECNEEMKKHIT